MKDRILAYLDDFSKGADNELATELKAELGLDDITFQQQSHEVQAAILHRYSQFAISTIDAFFQKVIRSFTRESGLIGDYRLEVEHDAVLEEVIDNLIDELGNNKELTEWVVEFAKENLENEKAWDVRFSLIEFAKEIFREEFKAIEEDVSGATAEPGTFKKLRESLWDTKNTFLTKVSTPARQVLDTMESRGWSIDEFYYGKGSGLLTFFNQFGYEKSLSKFKPPGTRITAHFRGKAANWPKRDSRHARDIMSAAEEIFVGNLEEILVVYENDFRKALSAEVALKNLYVFGLISDIARKLKEYKTENNLMLLADAPKLLNGIIGDSDTPFIYEKVGSFYRNYLIDEFQDTSGMQWKNFQPLIVNSLDQGYPALVVGDVKQAIYRWRGGDLNLLQKEIASQIGENKVRVEELDQNFRSAKQVINFNNALFKSASSLVSMETASTLSQEVYEDVSQKEFRNDEGFVEIRFLRPEREEDPRGQGAADELEPETSAAWTDLSLEQIPLILEKLQEHGAALKDIAILVRRNDEGQRIATSLLHYKNSGKAKPGCAYDVVSNESLRIDGAASVNLLLAALRYLLNADDSIARAQLGYEFARLHEPGRAMPDVFAVTNLATFETNLPEEFTSQKTALKKLPLIELTETLIGIFKLGKQRGEVVYLQAFQDLVLEFSNREKNDLGTFLEWWEENRKKKSIQIAGDVDAAQILTIHKSKGLQFPYVIVPFCAWNLDHESFKAPNLWVKTEHEPFHHMGYLPVKYGKVLEQTFFEADYRTELTRSWLDNLNLLYVACTRAEHGLIVMAPHPDLKMRGTVASVLSSSIHASDELHKAYDSAHDVLRLGAWSAAKKRHSPDSTSISLNEYVTTDWRNKLVIKQSAEGLFEEAGDYRTRINYGIHMHEVLSRMRYGSDMEGKLREIVIDGLITEDEAGLIRKQLDDLFRIHEVANWFSEEWIVKTEVPVLIPGGGENRLDRLIYRDKQAVVIDFKTGEPRKADNNQVLAYIDILRQMNFTDIRGYLLYLRNNDVVEVRPGAKEKTIKKIKDRDQLSLGF